jgi:Sigma-70 region 2
MAWRAIGGSAGASDQREHWGDDSSPQTNIHHGSESKCQTLACSKPAILNHHNDLRAISLPAPAWLFACAEDKAAKASAMPQFTSSSIKGGRLYRDEVAISAAEREVLLLRAQTGDRDALNALFESCHKKLHGRALRILPRPQDAEDAVQDAMFAAFTHLERFQGRADFLTWATRILINSALQQMRRTRAKPTVSWEQVAGERERTACEEYLKDPQPTPPRATARKGAA